jgi:hypothetical protein
LDPDGNNIELVSVWSPRIPVASGLALGVRGLLPALVDQSGSEHSASRLVVHEKVWRLKGDQDE